MNRITFVCGLFCSLLVSFLIINYVLLVSNESEPLELFIGVDLAYDNPEEIKKLADELSNYTNLFVIGCTGISYNITQL